MNLRIVLVAVLVEIVKIDPRLVSVVHAHLTQAHIFEMT